ncbi:MAG: helix-turn-helix domain-containing protein [Planctomyces sp.]|nr:helix-turn-helix domain-containing protein [Planctomyces sp.]
MATGIGETLQKLRKARGISLRELAPRVGIHFSHLSHIENGRQPCGRETLIRLAEILGGDAEMLLAEAGHRLPPFRVLGNIAAGVPIEAQEHIETFDLTEHFDPRDHFLLRVRGDSMILDGINDGDLAIIRHATRARSGQTVAAIVDGGEATLKRYVQKDSLIILQPANRRMKPLMLAPGRVEIRGVLVGVLRTKVE